MTEPDTRPEPRTRPQPPLSPPPAADPGADMPPDEHKVSTTTLGPDRVEHPYRHAHQQYAEAGWEGILPLPAGRKKTPPSGFTGYTGGFPEPERRAAWAGRPRQNIALRLPARVVGLDVDSYKPGTLDRLRRVEAQAGERPATWRTSRRPDLDHPVVQERSGIYLYRLPDGSPEPDATALCEGVELIRFGHRYALVWPSRIGAGGDEPAGVYGWWGPDGDYTEQIPSPGLLPVLPAEWLNTTVSPERRPGSPVPAPEPEGGWQVGQPGSAAPEGRHQRLVAAAVNARRNGQPRTAAQTEVETLAAGIKPAALNPGPGGRPSEADAVVEWAYTTVAAEEGKAQLEWWGLSDRMLAACLKAVNTEIRWNTRAGQVEVLHPQEGWTQGTDRLIEYMFQRIEERVRVDKGKGPTPPGWGGARSGARASAFQALLHTKEVDPFREWLDQLPPWDGTARINNLIEAAGLTPAETTDKALMTWAGQSVLVAAAARAYKPGRLHREMIILIGPQAIGKSTLWRMAIPPEHPEWYGDQLNMKSTAKQRLEAIDGKVLVECAEMAGFGKADIESMKAFLSSTADNTARRAYARTAEQNPRRCVLVGTSNDNLTLPNDPTGNTRYVPILLTAGNPAQVREWWETNRTQAWAEALHRYQAGQPTWMPDDLMDAHSTAADRHQTTDEEVEHAVAWYREVNPYANRGHHVNVQEMMTAISRPAWTTYDPATGEPVRPVGLGLNLKAGQITRVLKAEGYTSRRTRRQGRQVRVWDPPPTKTDTNTAAENPPPEPGQTTFNPKDGAF